MAVQVVSVQEGYLPKIFMACFKVDVETSSRKTVAFCTADLILYIAKTDI